MLADCVSSRPGALPALSLQHSDTKACAPRAATASHDVSHNAPSPPPLPSRTLLANPPVPPGASTAVPDYDRPKAVASTGEHQRRIRSRTMPATRPTG